MVIGYDIRYGMDDGIVSLVSAVQSIDLPTDSSCQGHMDRHKHRHPWVGFDPFSYAKISALEHFVTKYNESHEIKWSVYGSGHGSWLTTHAYQYVCCEYSHNPNELKRMSSVRLGRLQESANELADYILEHRKDEDIRELILFRGM